MRKALELNWYTLDADGNYNHPAMRILDYIDIDHWIACKRLTGAELAAEWHKQDNHCGQKFEGYAVAHNGESLGSEEYEADKLRTMHRFATRPHFDEVV